MAKFKPGDKVTWRYPANGSYSNEVIDYFVPPNGYAFKDGGVGAESELRAGWVPESQTGRANMPPLNSCATNAKFKVGDFVETDWGTGRIIRVGGVEKYGGEETYGVILDKRPYGRGMWFKEHELKPYQKFPNVSAVRSRNAVVAKAINAQRAARNGHLFCDERDYPSVAAVKKEYPGQIVKRVTGGWMVFDTATDYDTWKAQK